MSSYAEVKAALTRSDDDLYRTIGLSEYGAFPSDPLRRGKQAYLNLTAKLREQICTSDEIRKLSQDNGESVALGSAIADLVLQHYQVSSEVSVSIAVLTVRAGVLKYCAIYWDTAEDATQ
ncbi:hypothetical protein [Rhodococcus sp. JVH1]|uniref:hypothetical protein n=1 Tax=Rhodococcus sp. JVH1 TaxID=745408 RepID=UPI0012F63CA8|nr:hypothetical protein [Rhodococcus sp. JVH1]